MRCLEQEEVAGGFRQRRSNANDIVWVVVHLIFYFLFFTMYGLLRMQMSVSGSSSTYTHTHTHTHIHTHTHTYSNTHTYTHIHSHRQTDRQTHTHTHTHTHTRLEDELANCLESIEQYKNLLSKET